MMRKSLIAATLVATTLAVPRPQPTMMERRQYPGSGRTDSGNHLLVLIGCTEEDGAPPFEFLSVPMETPLGPTQGSGQLRGVIKRCEVSSIAR